MTSIFAATPFVSVPVPIKSLSPLFPCVPTPNVKANSPCAKALGAVVPEERKILIIVDIFLPKSFHR